MGVSNADGRVVILSTDMGGGSGAYTMLGYFLEAASERDEKPLLVLPSSSEYYAKAIQLGFPVLALPVKQDKLIQHLGVATEIALHLEGARAICAWHSRGFELALMLRRKLKVPAIGVFHDGLDAPAHGRLRHLLLRWSARRLDARIFVSHALREMWSPYIGRGVNEVIHNGLPDRPEECTEHPDARVRIGFLGMYSEHKGFDQLCAWIQETFAVPVRWQLYGKPAPGLEANAQRLAADLPESVLLCGHKSPAQIFGEIDILVHLSPGFDSYPTVLLEAARAGIPVVATNVGGSPEIIRQEETGVLFDPRSPDTGLAGLRRLVEDESLRRRRGDAARVRFKNHLGVEPMVAAYFELWNRLTKKK